MGRPPIKRAMRPAATPVLSASRATDPASTQRAVEESAEAVRELQRRPTLTGENTGDIFYRDANGRVVVLPIGAADDVLVVDAGLPSWGATSGLVGPAGPAGATGSIGATGLTGAMGPAGFDGADGAAGDPGMPGPVGATGAVGPMGPPGTDGLDGENGEPGPPGLGSGIVPRRVVGASFDGGGSPPTAGSVGYLVCMFNGSIDQWSIVADASGSAVVDVWKAAGTIPTNADTIAGAEKPTLAAQQLASDTNLTTWTTPVAAGDVFGFELESVATCTRLTVEVRISESA